MEATRYGPRLSALVGLLGSAFRLSFRKTQTLLDQLLGVQISRGAMAIKRPWILPVNSRWFTSMKLVPPPVMRMEAILIANAAGKG